MCEDIREYNAKMNRFAREKEARSIGSPFRVHEYCNARMKGKSPEDALKAVRSRGKVNIDDTDPRQR